MGLLVPDVKSDDETVDRRIKNDVLRPRLFQDPTDGGEMARSGERLDDGAVGKGVVSEVGLLCGPVEEAESEGVVG